MTRLLIQIACASALMASTESRATRPMDMGVSPQAIGSPGIVWYATWESALAEAKRSQRPIFFMAAAAQCGGISGVF